MKNDLKVDEDELLPEYDFDYSKGKPNPYVGRFKPGKIVELDEDVAKVFDTKEKVNEALRLHLKTNPDQKKSA